MKNFILLCTSFIIVLNLSFSQDNKKIYVFEIKEEIAAPAWRTVKKAIEQAHDEKSDVILIRMNTYGGLVDVADSIRTKILQSTIPVYVWIENNAASAGALISIACDSIYMMPGATIGAATVVNQTGEQVPDKYQSYMRKKMRATAEETGRDPDIAEAMVDPDKVVPGISDSGKVVTFTTTEAIQHGFCEAEIKSVKEIFKRQGVDNYTLIEHEQTSIDKIIGFLISPMISGLLIMIIIGGIYFELQTPGIGFPLIAAIAAAILYFAPLYLEGLADNWEILLAFIGLVLIGLEIFVIPGFGIAGIVGITLFVSGLALSLIGNVGFDFEPVDGSEVTKAFLTVVVAATLSLAGSIFLGAKFLQSKMFSEFVLNTSQEKEKGYVGIDANEFSLVGKNGVAATFLRPSGKVEIEGDLYDATAQSGFIEKGEKVVVIKFETAQLTVKKIS